LAEWFETGLRCASLTQSPLTMSEKEKPLLILRSG
jgi:hypothetical protein